MARTYLFLVHGVGKHPADTWAAPWKKVLLAKLRRYAPYASMSDADIEKQHVCFRPIGYDSIFEGYRTRWGGLAKALTATEIVSHPGALTALQWVAAQDSDDALQKVFWEKVLDALLWATNPQARAAVIAHVNKQLVDGLVDMNKENKGENRAHVVAHSLGTSVISDALIALNGARSVHKGTLDTKVFQWRSLSMVANTSRLLEPRFDVSDDLDPGDFKVYNSKLRPGSRSSIVQSYRNVRHVIDPITWPRRFAPLNWPSQPYSDIETSNYDLLSGVHDFETYAANPYFHLPFFQTVLGNSRLGKPKEVERALKDLSTDFPKIADVEFPELRALVERDPDKSINLRVLVEFLTKAFKELR